MTSRKLHFHGKPCPGGHTLRYVKNGLCVECMRERARKGYQDNPEDQRLRSTKWRNLNKEKERARFLKWAGDNKEKRRASRSRYRARRRAAPGNELPGKPPAGLPCL